MRVILEINLDLLHGICGALGSGAAGRKGPPAETRLLVRFSSGVGRCCALSALPCVCASPPLSSLSLCHPPLSPCAAADASGRRTRGSCARKLSRAEERRRGEERREGRSARIHACVCLSRIAPFRALHRFPPQTRRHLATRPFHTAAPPPMSHHDPPAAAASAAPPQSAWGRGTPFTQQATQQQQPQSQHANAHSAATSAQPQQGSWRGAVSGANQNAAPASRWGSSSKDSATPSSSSNHPVSSPPAPSSSAAAASNAHAAASVGDESPSGRSWFEGHHGAQSANATNAGPASNSTAGGSAAANAGGAAAPNAWRALPKKSGESGQSTPQLNAQPTPATNSRPAPLQTQQQVQQQAQPQQQPQQTPQELVYTPADFGSTVGAIKWYYLDPQRQFTQHSYTRIASSPAPSPFPRGLSDEKNSIERTARCVFCLFTDGRRYCALVFASINSNFFLTRPVSFLRPLPECQFIFPLVVVSSLASIPLLCFRARVCCLFSGDARSVRLE